MVATDLETIWVGTADEIDLLRRTLAQRFPHLELVVGTAYDGDLELTEISAATGDLDYVRPAVAEVLRRLRPVRERVADSEKSITALLAELVASREAPYDHADDAPLSGICRFLEHTTVPALLEGLESDGHVDLWIDGFVPDSVERRERGVNVSGVCWCGHTGNVRREIRGRFEAVLELADDGTLGTFELRFADAEAMTNEGIITTRAPDHLEDEVEGHCITVRKHASPTSPWAFRIVKGSSYKST